jgi:hypothetical protein
MMKDEEESYKINGTTLGEKYYNPAIIDKAYPRGTKERERHEARLGTLKIVARIFEDEGDVSIEELDARIQEARPAAGPNFAERAEAWRDAEKRRDKLVKMRTEDPAEAVESSTIVKEVRSKFERGVPKSENEKRMLIEARMSAQRQLGIPKELRSPITDGEAESLAAGLEDVPEEAIQSRLEDLAATVRKNYGKDYSGVVLKAVIRNMIRRNEQRETMLGIAQQLSSGGELGPMDIERAKELNDLRARNVLNWRGDQIRRNRELEGRAMMSRDAARRIDEAARLNSLTPGLVGPSGGSGTLTQGLSGRPFPKPTKEDEAAVRNGKMTQREFEKKFGLTPTEALKYRIPALQGRQ